MSATITIRIDPKTKERLEKLAQATDRSMSYFVSHALEQVIAEVTPLKIKNSYVSGSCVFFCSM
jgi:predicted transcriptional regulator